MYLVILGVGDIEQGAQFWTINPDGSQVQVHFNVVRKLEESDMDLERVDFMERIGVPLMLPVQEQFAKFKGK